MSTNPAAYALLLMRQFERAVRDHAFKGAQHPNEWAEIEERYQRSKEKLARKIGQLAADSARLAEMYDHKDRSPL